MQPGDKVRLKANPGRVGILGNEKDGPPERQRVLVTFLDGQEEFVLPGALEKLEKRPQGPYQLMASGRYGRASDLRGLTTYYRLSGRLANLIYSLNTTNTDFYAYQFRPVLQFLDSPSNGILIADEVGLGKTIEAGLIWTELRAREDAHRLLVVCPAMLCAKWRDELSNRFDVTARIVDANELLDLLQAQSQGPVGGFAYIASVQGIRPSRNWDDKEEPSQTAAAKLARFLDGPSEVESFFDLVIVDEAHYLRNRETQTYKLGALLREVTQNMVMLSATPIQLRSRDLFNLVHLLDEDAFADESMFDWSLQANAPLVTLRERVLATELPHDEFVAGLQESIRSPFLASSTQLKYLLDHPPDNDKLASPGGRAELADQLDRINPLGKVITRTLKRDVQEHRVERAPRVIKARMSPVEADFYENVTETVRDFCADLDMAEGFMLTIPQRQMASSMAAACRGWINGHDAGTEEVLKEMADELDTADDDEVVTSPAQKRSGLLLRKLRAIAVEVGDFDVLARHDSKYLVLSSSLRDYWKEYPGRKVVLFSFYRNTLYYLAERLRAERIESVILHGGMDKQERLERFKQPDGPDILLSSEVAAEGVDLQFSSLVVNYDLPWNPAKIEQRIGRIDRIGQQAERVLIWNLVYEETIDERVYERLLDRLNIFREALGSIEAILGDEIRKLTHDLLSHRLTREEEVSRIDRARVAIETLNRRQIELEREASNLIAHGKFIQDKVQAAKELGRFIRGEDLLAYVSDFFKREYPGTRMVRSSRDVEQFCLELSVEAKTNFDQFVKSNHLEGKTGLLASTSPELRFDNTLQGRRAGIEVVVQDHPLVRFVSTQIRGSGGDPGYLPVSAVTLLRDRAPSQLSKGVYVYVVMRWAFSGARVIERLEYVARALETGIRLDGQTAEQLVNNAALEGADWLGANAAIDTHRAAELEERCRAELEDRFHDFVATQQREDADRIQLMIDLLEKRLIRKREKSNALIATYRDSPDEKRRRMIHPEQGRLEKEEKRVHERIEELRLRHEKFGHQSSAVSAGVICVI